MAYKSTTTKKCKNRNNTRIQKITSEGVEVEIKFMHSSTIAELITIVVEVEDYLRESTRHDVPNGN